MGRAGSPPSCSPSRPPSILPYPSRPRPRLGLKPKTHRRKRPPLRRRSRPAGRRRSPALWPPAKTSSEAASLEAFIDGVVAAHRRVENIPGVSVSAVVDDRVAFAKGYGLADIESQRPVEGDRTLFRIGSVSKDLRMDGGHDAARARAPRPDGRRKYVPQDVQSPPRPSTRPSP